MQSLSMLLKNSLKNWNRNGYRKSHSNYIGFPIIIYSPLFFVIPVICVHVRFCKDINYNQKKNAICVQDKYENIDNQIFCREVYISIIYSIVLDLTFLLLDTASQIDMFCSLVVFKTPKRVAILVSISFCSIIPYT